MTKKLFNVLALVAMVIFAGSAMAENDGTTLTIENTGNDMFSQNIMVTPFQVNDLATTTAMASRRSYHSRRSYSPFSVGAHVTVCPNGKFGVGLQAGYNFTEMLRFVLDGDYYLHGPSEYSTMDAQGNVKEKFFGRLWDINPGLNIVFGSGDFHFYLVTGFSLAYGHSELESIIDDVWGDNSKYVVINGREYCNNGVTYYRFGEKYEEYYDADKDKPDPLWAFGLNLGCGVEYQVSDAFRISLEQTTSLVFPISQTAWTWKLAGNYCF